MSRLRDWLELCRIPNVFTAMADPLAGALLVGAVAWDTPAILLVMLASACMYTGGIVLNDWNDYRRDLRERPERPLPSGRIRRLYALCLAAALLFLGPTLTYILGTEVNQVAVLLVLAIVTYDVLLKHTPIAPAVMAFCRGLNLLLGMMLVDTAESLVSTQMRVYLFFLMWAYVLGVTLFARYEVEGRHRWLLLSGAGTAWAAILGAALLAYLFPGAASHRVGLAWCSALMAFVGYRMIQALLTPTPQRVQLAVTTSVMGIILLDAAFVAFTRDFLVSVPVALLLIPAVLIGRKMYST